MVCSRLDKNLSKRSSVNCIAESDGFFLFPSVSCPRIFHGKMDLWDMTHKFFTTNITGQNFKIQDVVTLAQQIDIPIVAPRYATGRVF